MIRSKDNFLQVSDGAWIYFEDYGKDKGEPIMILHGFLCSSKFFYKNIDALSADHRLVLIDWRGHGSSSKTLQNLTMDRCAKDVHELIEYLGLEDVTVLRAVRRRASEEDRRHRLCLVPFFAGVLEQPFFGGLQHGRHDCHLGERALPPR